MRPDALVLVFVGVFVAVIGAVYWVASYEPAGTVLLLAGVGFAVIPGVFLTRRRPASPSSGVVGSFPESSVWPIVLAAGAAISGVGLIFGAWAALPGGILLLIGFTGGVLESRR